MLVCLLSHIRLLVIPLCVYPMAWGQPPSLFFSSDTSEELRNVKKPKPLPSPINIYIYISHVRVALQYSSYERVPWWLVGRNGRFLTNVGPKNRPSSVNVVGGYDQIEAPFGNSWSHSLYFLGKCRSFFWGRDRGLWDSVLRPWHSIEELRVRPTKLNSGARRKRGREQECQTVGNNLNPIMQSHTWRPCFKTIYCR